MDHNGFEWQTRHFPATIKINWRNSAWCIAGRDCANVPLCHTTCFAGSTSWNQVRIRNLLMDWIILHFNENFTFKMFIWLIESKVWSGFGYFTPDLEKIKQLLVCSKHQNTWDDTGNVVKVFFSIQSKKKNVRQWKETKFLTPFVVNSATSLLLNLQLWNDVRWILKLEFDFIGKLCQLVSWADQALTKFDSFEILSRYKTRDKNSSKHNLSFDFVKWILVCLLVQKSQIGT